MELTKEKLEELILECKSKSDVCKKLNISPNGAGYKKIDTLFENFGIKFEFKKSKNHFVKYETVTKKCPVCENEFETKKGSKKEKITCSHSCSNTFFRSGVNNPNWKEETYRSTCFLYHKHECVVCKENLLLDVHHLDSNKKNNKPENLIPLCATHHNYWHSRYKYLIEDKVLEYVENFKRVVD
jgi:hypothetical protein